MQRHRQSDRRHEVWVGPDRQDQERFVLAQRVTGVKHLHNWMDVSTVSSRTMLVSSQDTSRPYSPTRMDRDMVVAVLESTLENI